MYLGLGIDSVASGGRQVCGTMEAGSCVSGNQEPMQVKRVSAERKMLWGVTVCVGVGVAIIGLFRERGRDGGRVYF